MKTHEPWDVLPNDVFVLASVESENLGFDATQRMAEGPSGDTIAGYVATCTDVTAQVVVTLPDLPTLLGDVITQRVGAPTSLTAGHFYFVGMLVTTASGRKFLMQVGVDCKAP